MGRRPFIAGNWKMNKGPAEADALARALKSALADNTAVDVAVAPVFVSIPAVAQRLQHTGIHVAGQNLHEEVSGAFTGEVPGEMLRQIGCTYVLCGHSERRSIFGESNERINRKVHAAFRSGLLPILCIGETLTQRDGDQVELVLAEQLASGLAGLEADQVAATTLAYEPVWAIGTGRTASPEQAQDAHAFIRSWLTERYPAYVGKQVRIQYGGSVKPTNAAELLAQPDIDGALVGGAALKVESFVGIIQAASA
jgi:triosephosphate isomerase